MGGRRGKGRGKKTGATSSSSELVLRTASTTATATTTSPSTSSSDRSLGTSAVVQVRYPSISIARPSRHANLHTEAVLHFLGHYNEKFFFGRAGDGDYMTPVLRADAARRGPLADIIEACGLATLGSMKNCPEMVVQANVRKTKVLRMLQGQLADEGMARSDSSVLTCLFLGSFEVRCLVLRCGLLFDDVG